MVFKNNNDKDKSVERVGEILKKISTRGDGDSSGKKTEADTGGCKQVSVKRGEGGERAGS